MKYNESMIDLETYANGRDYRIIKDISLLENFTLIYRKFSENLYVTHVDIPKFDIVRFHEDSLYYKLDMATEIEYRKFNELMKTIKIKGDYFFTYALILNSKHDEAKFKLTYG